MASWRQAWVAVRPRTGLRSGGVVGSGPAVCRAAADGRAPSRDACRYASLCSPASGRPYNDPACWGAPSWAIGSVEERCVHTAEVAGSNPASPTQVTEAAQCAASSR